MMKLGNSNKPEEVEIFSHWKLHDITEAKVTEWFTRMQDVHIPNFKWTDSLASALYSCKAFFAKLVTKNTRSQK